MSEKAELEEILVKARQIARDLKITLSEALVLITAHQIVCIHFHIDSGFAIGAIRRVEGERPK